MSVLFSDEQLAIRETARRFAAERLAPRYQDLDQAGRLDRDTLREMGDLGLIGASLPAEHGGLDASSVTAGIIIEAIAQADPNVAYVPLLTMLCGRILADHASAELAARVLPALVSGERLVALGLTEPRGGSDAAGLQLRAEACEGGYRLRGEKTSISLADQADDLVLFARTGSADSGARGISAFHVDLHADGISRHSWHDLGSRAVGRGSIRFDDVFVPGDQRLGAEGMGFIQVMQGFDYSRALIGLQCLAPARASLDEAWAHTRDTRAFDTPLAQFQGVSFPLAEHETHLEACRLLCYHTLRLRDDGAPHTAEAAMVKWWAPKLACDIIQQCLLTVGHAGYSMDLPHQQRLRDILGLQIGDGTAQIMKLIIAREKVGRVAVQYRS